MLHFGSDYLEGAHPLILQKLVETNLEKTPGYGGDHYCKAARQKIRQACGCPEAEIHFLMGGTQTNATVIGAMLRSYEGVIAPNTGHISLHEAGAIEMGGHKVLELPHQQGKITVRQVADCLAAFHNNGNAAHMVWPGMVYVSHPTEYGTLYTGRELEQLSEVCKKYGIPLFLDGARLGYGLMASDTDVTLETIARVCDVFYIGGTKVGALFGEAVVMPRPGRIPHFVTVIKQQGGLLAKGRLLGIQFDVLFTDNLYYRLARHAVVMAEKLQRGFRDRGYRLYLPSSTNQQFVILTDEQMRHLAREVSFSFWEKADSTHTVVRFATSWATREEDVDALLRLI